MRKLSILLVVAVLLGLVSNLQFAGAATQLDWDITNGHYYTQTNGQPEGTSQTGFSVTDADGVLFWTEFQRLGGVARVGYPMSKRFQWDGFTTQVFQKAVFQWRANIKSVFFINVFDQMSVAGKDQWLYDVRSTPKPLDGAVFDAGKSWNEVVTARQALLDANPAIKEVYFSVSDPLSLYGLPTSEVIDNGNHYVVRLQRAVIQQWKEAVPWAAAGEVTVANGGDVAVESGMFDPAITTPMNGPSDSIVVLPTPTATAQPTPTKAAVNFSFKSPVRYAPNEGTQWVEGKITNPDGSGRNGVVVRVSTPDNSWSTLSRPTGSEMRGDNAGVYVVVLRSGADQFADFSFNVEVVEDNGTSVTSDKVSFSMERDASRPDSRQVAFVDFRKN